MWRHHFCQFCSCLTLFDWKVHGSGFNGVGSTIQIFFHRSTLIPLQNIWWITSWHMLAHATSSWMYPIISFSAFFHFSLHFHCNTIHVSSYLSPYSYVQTIEAVVSFSSSLLISGLCQVIHNKDYSFVRICIAAYI